MSLINNALSGSLAAQAALNATSQNIANQQTKGYTRQGVLLGAIGPGIAARSAGNGVAVSNFLRYSDAYKSQQMWRANSELAQRSNSQPYLSQMERVMGDDKSGLSNGVDDFFKALNAAAVDPTSSPLRQQVVTAANSMSQQFNSIYNLTKSQQLSVNQQRAAALPGLNALTAGIAVLNEKIAGASATGTNTSALVDERDLAIDNLAKVVGIDVIAQPDGTSTISLRNGQPLVAGSLAAVISTTSAGGVDTLKLTFAQTTFTVDSRSLGAQLGGLADYEHAVLLPLQKSISQMAEQMANMINTQLLAGYKADGSAGEALFTFNPTSATGMLQINPAFKSADLAFSGDPAAPGDSKNLQELIGIKARDVTLDSIGTVMLGDADTQLVGKLGIDSQQNQATLKTATTIRQQAEDDWAATSSVNTDEEAINLLEFQKMYQSNMKVISVANDLFDATLAMMG